MATYEPTADPDVVNKVETGEIDLSVYVGKYIVLESQWLNRPKLKTEPDQETLNMYNKVISEELAGIEGSIRSEAQRLYEMLMPIYEAGLIPAKYNDELLRLQNFLYGN